MWQAMQNSFRRMMLTCLGVMVRVLFIASLVQPIVAEKLLENSAGNLLDQIPAVYRELFKQILSKDAEQFSVSGNEIYESSSDVEKALKVKREQERENSFTGSPLPKDETENINETITQKEDEMSYEMLSTWLENSTIQKDEKDLLKQFIAEKDPLKLAILKSELKKLDCKHAYFQYCLGKSYYSNKNYPKALEHFKFALNWMDKNSAPSYYQYMVIEGIYSCGERIYARKLNKQPHQDQSKAVMEDVFQSAINLLNSPEAIEWPRKMLASIAPFFKKLELKEKVRFMERLKQETKHNYVSCCLQVRLLIDEAWEARGNSWGYTVKNEDWKIFGKKLDEADQLLHEFIEEFNQFPEIFSYGITLAMAGHSKKNEREWFDLSVKAQFDYEYSYEKLCYAMLPRWGGSHKIMIDFAKECYETHRFDTIVVDQVLNILKKIRRDKTYWKDAYREFDTYPMLIALLDEKIKRYPDLKLDHLHKKLVHAYAASNYGDVMKYRAEIGAALDVEKLYIYENKRRTWTEIKIICGDYGEALKDDYFIYDESGEIENCKTWVDAYFKSFDPDLKYYVFDQLNKVEFNGNEHHNRALLEFYQAIDSRESILLAWVKYREGVPMPDLKLKELISNAVPKFALQSVEKYSNPGSYEKHSHLMNELIDDYAQLKDSEKKNLKTEFELAKARLFFQFNYETKSEKAFFKDNCLKYIRNLDVNWAILDMLATNSSRKKLSNRYEVISKFYNEKIRYQSNQIEKYDDMVLNISGYSGDLALEAVRKIRYEDSTPVLLLKLHKYCLDRDLKSEAETIMMRVEHWLDRFNVDLGDTYWSNYHAMLALGATTGFEAKALEYSLESCREGSCDSGFYFSAYFLAHEGRYQEAVNYMIDGLERARDSGTFIYADKKLKGVPALRAEILKYIKEKLKEGKHDDLLNLLNVSFGDN